jgi:hypothetical protein
VTESQTLLIQPSAFAVDLAWWRANARQIGQGAEQLAAMTSSELDDKAARFITALSKSPELWDWFGKDVLGQGGVPMMAYAAGATADPNLLAAARASDEKPEEFVQYIPAILEVLEIVLAIIERRRKRNG